MLTDIIDTSGKAKLATFFLNSIARSFHPEEVRKNIKESGSAVALNLREFVKSGFLKPIHRGGEMYYRLNFKYPYLEELREFLVKKNSTKFKDIILKELQKLDIDLVVLTGLFTAQTDIQIDILMVGRKSPASIKNVIEKIEKEIRHEINYTLFSPEDFKERINMYDRFTRDVFDNPHLIVVDKNYLKKNNFGDLSSGRKDKKSNKK